MVRKGYMFIQVVAICSNNVINIGLSSNGYKIQL